MSHFDSTQPVYIIGGGASLRDFNWNLLHRKNCIAVNTAGRKATWANIMFFSDSRYFEWNKDAGGQHFFRFKGLIISTAAACKGMSGRIEYLDPTELTIHDDSQAFTAAGCNSGVQAIVLAHKLGAKKIILLGFDNTPGHWHDGTYLAHPITPSPSVYADYAADMEKLAGLGLDIVNANEHSALTCFPVVPRSSAF